MRTVPHPSRHVFPPLIQRRRGRRITWRDKPLPFRAQVEQTYPYLEHCHWFPNGRFDQHPVVKWFEIGIRWPGRISTAQVRRISGLFYDEMDIYPDGVPIQTYRNDHPGEDDVRYLLKVAQIVNRPIEVCIIPFGRDCPGYEEGEWEHDGTIHGPVFCRSGDHRGCGAMHVRPWDWRPLRYQKFSDRQS